LGLSRLLRPATSQDLRLSDLPLLKEWDLDRLGITLMGHKKKLLKAFHQSLNRIASTPPRISFSAAQRVPPHSPYDRTRTTHRTRGSLGSDGGEGDPLYWVMEPSELSLGKRLGGGNFGEVGDSVPTAHVVDLH
jgi:hypothetical protein